MKKYVRTEDLMEQFKKLLEERLIELDQLEKSVRKNKRYIGTVPEGRLRITPCRGKYRYYFRSVGEEKERYMSKNQTDSIRKMVQMHYDEKMLKQIHQTRSAIDRFLKDYNPYAEEEVYEKMGKGRQELVDPVILPKDEYIERWYREHPGSQNCYYEEGKYVTDRGEKVRSKSEVLLANLFHRKGIPYQYEACLSLHGRDNFPDFLLLNVKKRKTAIWEHFGLVDSEDYVQKNMKKLDEYERAGYQVGVDVLFSMEFEGCPLDVKEAERRLQRWMEK